MKNKILALLATVGLVASASAVEINENLSINGFIDGSYQNNEINGDASGIGVDEVEVNVLVNVGNVSGAIHIDTDGSSDVVDDNGDTGNAGDELFNIEQVHLTYTLDSGLSVTFGRYASALGLEREDPAGLYTFSRAYVTPGLNLGNVDNQAYEGLAFGYNTGDLGINVSLDQEAGTRDLEGEDLSYEIALTYTGVENLSATLGYRTNNGDTAATESELINLNATYTAGKALIGGEITTAEVAGVEVDAYTILLDYDITDKLGAAVRYSNEEIGAGDASKLTVAPNYSITDALGVIIEYSDTDADNAALEGNEFAVELTYTF